MIDFIFDLPPGDVVYDIETYPNCFTFYAIHAETKQEWLFEISEFKNETEDLCLFMDILKNQSCRMVGYNNINFDYPVIHYIYLNRHTVRVKDIYQKAQSILSNYDDKFSHIIRPYKRIIHQIDPFAIHHFDNKARATKLKVLEFNMRSENIQDLPFDPKLNLIKEQIPALIKYNRHDVLQTLKFYEHTLDKIKFREELSLKYNRDFMNHNDTKIGKDYFIMQLEQNKPGSCYKKIDGERKINQTPRDKIHLGDVILPYVKFDNPEFNRILTFFKNKTITETKGSFKDVNCIVNGFKFVFGTGGIHGSVENKIIEADEDYIIEDWDVASYYPNLSIVNSLHPAHLGQEFCKIYRDVYEQRKKYAKGTSENAMLKLALNGVYGDSNSKYSPFYDPQYTMSITINGQLLLCMLVEELFNCFTPSKGRSVDLIQINTDGLTIRYHKDMQYFVHSCTSKWEALTKLTLESAEYNRMFIRDVNNYIAEYTDGSVKRKGAYEYKMEWHQNHSSLVVAKAAEQALLHGTDIREFIETHDDVMDFMLRTKLPRKYKLISGNIITRKITKDEYDNGVNNQKDIFKCNINNLKTYHIYQESLGWAARGEIEYIEHHYIDAEEFQNVSRYYISTNGRPIMKLMPSAGPLGGFKRKNMLLDSYYKKILKEVGDEWDERIHTGNKKRYEERVPKIHTGWTVKICNDLSGCTFTDINYEYYIKEAEKLVGVLNGN